MPFRNVYAIYSTQKRINKQIRRRTIKPRQWRMSQCSLNLPAVGRLLVRSIEQLKCIIFHVLYVYICCMYVILCCLWIYVVKMSVGLKDNGKYSWYLWSFMEFYSLTFDREKKRKTVRKHECEFKYHFQSDIVIEVVNYNK